MANTFVFNPFTANFDEVGSGGSASIYWLDAVVDYASLPTTDPDGATRVVLNEDAAYTYNLATTTWIFTGKIKLAAVGAVPNADGYTIGVDNTLTLQPADATHPGAITAIAQTIGGAKTFAATTTVSQLIDSGLTASKAVYSDGSKQLASSTTSDVELGYVTGVTSSIQTQLNGKLSIILPSAEIFVGNVSNVATGVAISGDLATTNAGVFTIQPAAVTASKLATVTDGITLDQSGAGSTLEVKTGGISDAQVNAAAAIAYSKLALSNSVKASDQNSQTATSTQPLFADGSGGATYRSVVAGDLPDLSSIYVTQTEVGAANGVASLDGSGKVPVSQLPSVVMEYQGAWNPSTNTPTLTDGTGTNGYVYYVTALFAGSVSGLTDPSMVNFQIGDLIIYSASIGKWQLVTPAAGVQSVNGAQGAVTVNAINTLTSDVTTSTASGSQSLAATVAFVGGSTASAVNSAVVEVAAAASINTPSTLVIRDPSGNFAAGTITASLTGVASGNLLKSPGDLDQDSFSAANSQSSAADVTGLAFANGSVRAAKIMVSVYVNATSSLYEFFELNIIQKGASWNLSATSVGDDSLFLFSVTSAGQIQYTSSTYPGFVAATIKFRALTLSV